MNRYWHGFTELDNEPVRIVDPEHSLAPGLLAFVIFLEDGVYSVARTHRAPAESSPLMVQDVINAVAGSEILHFFVLVPSLQERGLTKNKDVNAVFNIGFPGLGKILFYPPGMCMSSTSGFWCSDTAEFKTHGFIVVD